MSYPDIDSTPPTYQSDAGVIQKLRADLRSLRHRNLVLLANHPKAGALILYPSQEAQRILHREALSRGRDTADLALQVLELVAKDNLFAAVLDK